MQPESVEIDFSGSVRVIDRALSMFGSDGYGVFIQCSFLNLTSYIFERYESCSVAVSNTNREINDVIALCERLEWTRDLAVRGQLDSSRWRDYSKLDIQLAVIRLRSALDHASMVIRRLAHRGDTLPTSFNALLTSLPKRAARLEHKLHSALQSAHWFKALRDVRDEMVHRAAYATVFGEPTEGLLFQISNRKHDGFIQEPGLMYNESIAHFDRYAAILLARTLVLLEDLGRALSAPPVKGPREIGQVRSYSPGYSVVREWMMNTRQVISALQA